jgi:hypothetical protein
MIILIIYLIFLLVTNFRQLNLGDKINNGFSPKKSNFIKFKIDIFSK